MKKVTLSYLLSIVAIVLFLGSCGGLKKMQDRASEIKYKVTPSPLEMHAEKVAVKVEGTIPPKYFDKKALMVVTPVLKYGTQEHTLKTKTLQGEKYKDNNEVVPYDAGKTFSYIDTIPYTDDMMVSIFELELKHQEVIKKLNLSIWKLQKV